MASRVICIDPWWNNAVEQQAFCRVYRMGQTQETMMTRFVVHNTIDSKMIQLQERKQIEIDSVMDKKSKKCVPPLPLFPFVSLSISLSSSGLVLRLGCLGLEVEETLLTSFCL